MGMGVVFGLLMGMGMGMGIVLMGMGIAYFVGLVYNYRNSILVENEFFISFDSYFCPLLGGAIIFGI